MADGRFAMGVNAPGISKTISGKYSLGFGDSVTLSAISASRSPVGTTHRETITITGNQPTMKDTDGKAVTFRRM